MCQYSEHRRGSGADHDHYVHRRDWRTGAGRVDLIDEVADEYERRSCQCESAPWRAP